MESQRLHERQFTCPSHGHLQEQPEGDSAPIQCDMPLRVSGRLEEPVLHLAQGREQEQGEQDEGGAAGAHMVPQGQLEFSQSFAKQQKN